MCKSSPRCPLSYAIQKGLFISRCASQRVIPMSRKVASLNPSSSRRERARRCHSAIRNLSWSQRGRGLARKVVIVMVLMTGSLPGNHLSDARTIKREWEVRCDHEHNLTFFSHQFATGRLRQASEGKRALHVGRKKMEPRERPSAPPPNVRKAA